LGRRRHFPTLDSWSKHQSTTVSFIRSRSFVVETFSFAFLALRIQRKAEQEKRKRKKFFKINGENEIN
jgi:hypothetical protein